MDTEIERFLTHPRYWLMYALPWPATDPNADMAEAAHVIAPPTVPAGQRDRLPPDVADLLGFVGVYASEHPDQRVIWFTDVTRWLEWEKDSSWSALGVDWEHALAQLTRPPFLGLYMTVNRRAYHHLINTAERFRVTYTDGHSEVLTGEERQAVHEAFERKLDADWPAYIRDMLASGHLTVG
ncbi:hypothetical protein [Streptomyces sp. MW-W600-10]|uniref:hypothetical protein n=1 Tax=Streptomyces sp. MW-W600-10 TaxID=2829819 RepID=UPI001C45A47A|nr:hypothetical protein [Streptomyces sp. MW-W600-10]MBV7246433.1 hypothetical protein [Streptomyces sp. MW-W600-10]